MSHSAVVVVADSGGSEVAHVTLLQVGANDVGTKGWDGNSRGRREVDLGYEGRGCHFHLVRVSQRCYRGSPRAILSFSVLSFFFFFQQMDHFHKSLFGPGYSPSLPLRRKARACSVFRLRLNSQVGVALRETCTFICFPFGLCVFLARAHPHMPAERRPFTCFSAVFLVARLQTCVGNTHSLESFVIRH